MSNSMALVPMGSEMSMAKVDPSAVAAAESVKAEIQSAYMMALHKPRNEDQSRLRILKACQRPDFAEKVEYSKPVGGHKITGASIRFAELALREWGNIRTATQTVYEDEEIRRVKVTITDLETNSSFGKEITVKKTVERKSSAGRDIVSDRVNSYGERIFIVKATDDELNNKEAALISKIIRNEGLRLIPQDITEEAIETARKTRAAQDKKDPDEARRKMLTAFIGIGIQPKNLAEYLGHGTDVITPDEIDNLRTIYRTIKDGEAKWIDYVNPEEVLDPESPKAKSKAKLEDLKKRVKGKKKEPAPEVIPEAKPDKAWEKFCADYQAAGFDPADHNLRDSFIHQHTGKEMPDELNAGDYAKLKAALDKFTAPEESPDIEIGD